MARQTKEWRAKSDDTKAPPRVRLRVFDKAGGVCHICDLPIKSGETWELDHVVALINGGENRETNLAPAHKHCHIAKTSLDAGEKSKVARVRKKHVGATQPKKKLQSQGFGLSEHAAKRQAKPSLPELPRRSLYQEAP